MLHRDAQAGDEAGVAGQGEEPVPLHPAAAGENLRHLFEPEPFRDGDLVTEGGTGGEQLQDFGRGEARGDAVLTRLEPGGQPGEMHVGEEADVILEEATGGKDRTDAAHPGAPGDGHDHLVPAGMNGGQVGPEPEPRPAGRDEHHGQQDDEQPTHRRPAPGPTGSAGTVSGSWLRLVLGRLLAPARDLAQGEFDHLVHVTDREEMNLLA